MNLGAPKTLNNMSGMPQMGAAFSGWTQSMSVIVISQTVVDGLVVEKSTSRSFNGVIQPLGPKQLMLKPEGERGWQWFMIHCLDSTLDLDINDKIQYNGTLYKVMAVNNYQLNNYIEYHVIADYQK